MPVGDVTSAFKILIEAHPDEAVAAFNAVGSAAESAKEKTLSWSDQITGLNQAFQLVTGVGGMVVDALKSIGGVALEAGKGLAELVLEGGEFGEQHKQFLNYAASMGKSTVAAEEFITQLQAITENTIDISKAMELSTKAMAAGFSGQQFDDFSVYVKRFTEATGQDFDAVAEKMLSAMTKGKEGALREIGIFVEKGASLSEITDKMRASLDKFGETGVNSADMVTSMANSWKEFTLRIGEALNDAPTLGKWLEDLAGKAFDFVKNFDYKPITEFFDTGLQYLEKFVDAFTSGWGSFSDIITQALTGGSTNAKEFFKYVNDLVFGAVETVGKAINDTIDLFKALNAGNWLGKIIDGFVQATLTGADAVAKTIIELFKLVADGAKSALGVIEGLVNNYPNLAEVLGIDAGTFANASRAIDDVKAGLDSIGAGLEAVFAGASGASEAVFQNINTGMESWRVDVDGIAAKHQEVNKAIDAINYTPLESKAVEAAKTVSTTLTEAFKVDLKAFGEDIGKIDFSKLKTSVNADQFKENLASIKREFADMADAAQEAFKKQQKAELAAYESSVVSQTNAKQLVKDFKDTQKAQLEQFVDAQEVQKRAFADRIAKETDGFKASADSAKLAYKDVGKALETSLDDAFKNAAQSGKAYLDAIAKDPFLSDSQRAMEAKRLYEEQADMQERLVKALEKAAQNRGDTRLTVDIDGTDGAIRELVAKVISECVIKARSEGILVAGV